MEIRKMDSARLSMQREVKVPDELLQWRKVFLKMASGDRRIMAGNPQSARSVKSAGANSALFD
jgi:hypothetical protein